MTIHHIGDAKVDSLGWFLTIRGEDGCLMLNCIDGEGNTHPVVGITTQGKLQRHMVNGFPGLLPEPDGRIVVEI